MSWDSVKLGRICKIYAGGDKPQNVSSEKNSINKYPIFSNGIDNDGLYGFTDKYQFEGNAITITGRGANAGTVFFRKDAFLPIIRLLTLIPESNVINPKYLYYLIKDRQFLSTGAAQPQITVPNIANVEIEYHTNLETQQGIVDILSTYDDLIENNQKQINLLEEAAQRLYKEWFVDLRFPGHKTTPITDGIPNGWEMSTVGDCSSLLRRGISPKYNVDGPFVVINQKCIRQSIVDFSEARRQEKVFPTEMNLIDSDITICSTGAGTLGRVGQVFGKYPNTTFDSHVTLVRANDAIGKQYLYQFLKSKQSYLQGMGKGSTNQLELSRGTIQELPILIPDKEITHAFEHQLQPIHNKITALSKQIMLLTEMRDTLLPKLMNGEIEV